MLLSIPYVLSSFMPRDNFDISFSVLEDIFNETLYLSIVSFIIFLLALLMILRVEVNILKKISASLFLLILSVKILPLIIDLQQKDLRELGKKYANTKEKILAYKINKPSFKGKIEFKNVRFEYTSNVEVLKGISFLVNPGETLAIVGPTGSGKTTIINLISRLYETRDGSIHIYGRTINDYTLN